jgi:hypothetical protein
MLEQAWGGCQANNSLVTDEPRVRLAIISGFLWPNNGGFEPPYFHQLRNGKAEFLRALIAPDTNGHGAPQIDEVRLAVARTD